MNSKFTQIILDKTGAKSFKEVEAIQTLWSGYGQIIRLELEGAKEKTIIAKYIKFPVTKNHPRGWNTNISHERKVKSYEVEKTFYQDFSLSCSSLCRVPRFIGCATESEEIILLLEDLDPNGYPERKSTLSWSEVKQCVKWLANFHATFISVEPLGLWSIGTYWHLETRPEELKALMDLDLKKVASLVDAKLNSCQFKTIVHGDAKVANFCFSTDGKQVAALDFQYVGAGCGMKDLAYFAGSVLSESDCERYETELLEIYFIELKKAYKGSSESFIALENEWRKLYPYAWTDFHRFLKGWSPEHWKINTYSEKIAKKVIKEIQNG